MSEYIVIKKFTDKEDKHKYAVGDRYPFRGFAKKERLDELSSKNNLRKEPLIKAKTEAKKTESVEEKKASEPKREEERPRRSSSRK